MFNMDAASKGVLAGWNNSVYDNIKAERFNRDQLVGQQIRSAENEYTQRNATLMNTPEYLNATPQQKAQMRQEVKDRYTEAIGDANAFGLDGGQINYDESGAPISRSTALNQRVDLQAQAAQQRKQQALANLKAKQALTQAAPIVMKVATPGLLLGLPSNSGAQQTPQVQVQPQVATPQNLPPVSVQQVPQNTPTPQSVVPLNPLNNPLLGGYAIPKVGRNPLGGTPPLNPLLGGYKTP